MSGKEMRGNDEAVESTAAAMAKADHERAEEEVARTKARLQQARVRHVIPKKALYRIRGHEANAVLTALPDDVRFNVIAFLVPDRQLWGFEYSVIATGVPSRKHREWTVLGYYWWNFQACQCDCRVTVLINRRLVFSSSKYGLSALNGRTFGQLTT